MPRTPGLLVALILFHGSAAVAGAPDPGHGGSAAAAGFSRGEFDEALRQPAADDDERHYLQARIALARGDVDAAAAAFARIPRDSDRLPELAWWIAHARRDPAAIRVAAARYCGAGDPTGRSCADSELFALSPLAHAVELEGPLVEVALSRLAPVPVVAVRAAASEGGTAVGGGAVVDTGASQTVLSTRLASRLGVRTTRVRFPVGNAAARGTADAGLAMLPVLEVGGARVRNLPVLVMDLGGLEEKGIDLILSPQHAFHGLSVTFDFARQILALAPSPPDADALAAAGSIVLEYLQVGFELVVRARFGGGPAGLFVLDTGLTHPFAVARDYARIRTSVAREIVQGVTGADALERVPPAPVSLGARVLVPSVAGLLTEPKRVHGIALAGLLGNGLWQGGAITLDTKARRLIVRPPPATRAPLPPPVLP